MGLSPSSHETTIQHVSEPAELSKYSFTPILSLSLKKRKKKESPQSVRIPPTTRLHTVAARLCSKCLSLTLKAFGLFTINVESLHSGEYTSSYQHWLLLCIILGLREKEEEKTQGPTLVQTKGLVLLHSCQRYWCLAYITTPLACEQRKATEKKEEWWREIFYECSCEKSTNVVAVVDVFVSRFLLVMYVCVR